MQVKSPDKCRGLSQLVRTRKTAKTMMREGNSTILDRSGPRIKTGATVNMGQQDYSGKYATVAQRCCEKIGRRRGVQRAKKKKEKARVVEVVVRVGAFNVGKMTGKGRQVADMMEKRRIRYIMHKGDKMERKQSKGAWWWVQAILTWGGWSKKWCWGGGERRTHQWCARGKESKK